MQNIRSILNLANNKVVEGDIQGAITYYETAFTQSQSAEYIGGLFCASKHLGDIYYNTNCSEHAFRWYEYADQLIKEDYLVEPLIKEAAMSVWNNAIALCSINEEWKEKELYYRERIEKGTTKPNETNQPIDTNYEKLIKKQENENRLYDNFFNSCRKNSLRLVLRYIHKGVDVNRINPQTKYTALHNACWRGHIDVVRALLRHGADIHILNGEGETSIQCAEVAKKPEIVELLQRVEKEGIEFLGPCEECQNHKNDKKE